MSIVIAAMRADSGPLDISIRFASGTANHQKAEQAAATLILIADFGAPSQAETVFRCGLFDQFHGVELIVADDGEGQFNVFRSDGEKSVNVVY